MGPITGDNGSNVIIEEHGSVRLFTCMMFLRERQCQLPRGFIILFHLFLDRQGHGAVEEGFYIGVRVS